MTDPTPDGPGYAAAVAELDAILSELDADDVDIDLLGDHVARAAELIALCRGRLDAARLRVSEIVATLDTPAESSTDGGHPPDGDEDDQ